VFAKIYVDKKVNVCLTFAIGSFFAR